MSLQYSKKEIRDEVDFLHADKYQSFLQVNCNALGIKIFSSDFIIVDRHDQAFSKIKISQKRS